MKKILLPRVVRHTIVFNNQNILQFSFLTFCLDLKMLISLQVIKNICVPIPIHFFSFHLFGVCEILSRFWVERRATFYSYCLYVDMITGITSFLILNKKKKEEKKEEGKGR